MRIKSTVIFLLIVSIWFLMPKNCLADVEYLPLIGNTSVEKIITRYNRILQQFAPTAYDNYMAGKEVPTENDGNLSTSYTLLGNDEQNVQFILFTVENKQVTSAMLCFAMDSTVYREKRVPDVLFFLLSACDVYSPNDKNRNTFVSNTVPLEIENVKEKAVVVKNETASNSCIIHKTFENDENMLRYTVIRFMEPANVKPRDGIDENNIPRGKNRKRYSIEGHYDFEGMGSPTAHERRSRANMPMH